MNISLTPLQKKILKWVGYPLLGIFTFLMAAAHTFPYDRLLEKIETQLAGKVDLQAADIKSGFFPGTVVLDGVTLKILPRGEGQKPVTIFIDKLTLKVGLLPLIFRRVNADLEAELGGGVLNLDVSVKKDSWSASGTTEAFPLGMLPPGVQQAFGGLPLSGGLTAEFEIDAPSKDVKAVTGHAVFECADCTVGDGKSKIQNQPPPGMRAPMAFAEGPTVPRLSLGTTRMEIKIGDGKAKLELRSESPDGALRLDWDVELQEKLGESKVTGCTRFKLAESLRSRAPNFVNVQMSLTSNKEPDGMYALPLHRIAILSNIRMNQREQCTNATGAPRPSLPPAIAPVPPPGTTRPMTPPVFTPPPANEAAIPDPVPIEPPAPPPIEVTPPPEPAPMPEPAPAPPPEPVHNAEPDDLRRDGDTRNNEGDPGIE